MIEYIDDPQDGCPDLIICCGMVQVGRINANKRGDYGVTMQFRLRNGQNVSLNRYFPSLEAAKIAVLDAVFEALGERYRHFRNGIYEIDHIRTEIVYIDKATGEPHERSAGEFFGTVTLPSGEIVKRFERIEND